MIDAVVMGRWGSTSIRTSSRRRSPRCGPSRASSAASRATSPTGLGAARGATAIVSRVGAEGHGDYVARGSPARASTSASSHRPVLADAADLLRGLAARPLPDHLLPQADRTDWQLAPEDFDAGGGRRARRSSMRRAPGWRSRRAARRRSPRLRAHRGTTIFDLDWRRRSGTTRRLSGAGGRGVAAADVVIGNEEEVEARAWRRADARPQARRARRDGVRPRRGDRGAGLPGRGRERSRSGRRVRGRARPRPPAGAHARGSGRRGTVAGAIVASRLACSEAMPLSRSSRRRWYEPAPPRRRRGTRSRPSRRAGATSSSASARAVRSETGRRRDRARPRSGTCRVEAEDGGLGARRPRERLRGMPWALYLPRDTRLSRRG